jgi:hypothetical protein
MIDSDAGIGQRGAGPHHASPPDQQVHRPGERGTDRSRGENAQADEEEPLAPEPVSQAAADEQQAREDHRVGVDDPLQFARGGGKLPDKGGQGHIEDGVVHTDDQRGGAQHR